MLNHPDYLPLPNQLSPKSLARAKLRSQPSGAQYSTCPGRFPLAIVGPGRFSLAIVGATLRASSSRPPDRDSEPICSMAEDHRCQPVPGSRSRAEPGTRIAPWRSDNKPFWSSHSVPRPSPTLSSAHPVANTTNYGVEPAIDRPPSRQPLMLQPTLSLTQSEFLTQSITL